MHGGLAVVVDGVDVVAEVERDLHRLDDFVLGAGLLAGRGVPRPAAAISGVRCRRSAARVGAELGQSSASVGIGGPRGQQERRRAMVLRLVRPTLTFFVMRALTSAPCSTSFLTNSRLVRLPEPSGAGSSSPPPGLADPGHVCSAVKPERWSFGSAPRPAGRRQLEVAVLDGQDQGGGPARGALRRRRAVRAGCMASLTSAPAFSRTATTSVRPSRTAKSRGVNPDERRVEVGPRREERLDDLGVALGRRPHQGRLPAPLLRVHVGPAGEQRLHGIELPGARGGHQGVSPPGRAAFGSAPASSSSSTIAALPFVQASESGVTP